MEEWVFLRLITYEPFHFKAFENWHWVKVRFASPGPALSQPPFIFRRDCLLGCPWLSDFAWSGITASTPQPGWGCWLHLHCFPPSLSPFHSAELWLRAPQFTNCVCCSRVILPGKRFQISNYNIATSLTQENTTPGFWSKPKRAEDSWFCFQMSPLFLHGLPNSNISVQMTSVMVRPKRKRRLTGKHHNLYNIGSLYLGFLSKYALFFSSKPFVSQKKHIVLDY